MNLSIDAELLAEAKAAGTNLSALLEQALREELKERRWQKWRDDHREATESMNRYEENREAIQSMSRYVEKHGLWYEGIALSARRRRLRRQDRNRTATKTT